MNTEKKWNPRYAAYAKASGKFPGDQLASDMQEFPDACMMNFSIWIQAQWFEWRKMKNITRDIFLSDADHQEFDVWLNSKGE